MTGGHGALPDELREIDVVEAGDHAIEGEAGEDGLARRRPEPRALLRVRHQVDHPAGQRFVFSRRHQPARAAVLEEIHDPADARGDDRQARGHRFEDRVRK